jgi:hypothetical protein
MTQISNQQSTFKSLQSSVSNLQPVLFSPAAVTLLVLTLVVASVIHSAGGDPLALARLGTRFSQADLNGSEGYDGQFVYYIARNPNPESVAPLLDAPAYRYQRILLPLLARWLAWGNLGAIPWILAGLGIISQTAGTWVVSRLLAGWGVNRWYAIVYGLWVGFVLAVRLDLPEPLAYALVAGAILATLRGRPGLGWLLYGLALFAKEVTVLFVVAQLIDDLFQRRWRSALGLIVVALVPYALFQVWLWSAFGQLGIGSGGAMATPFELLPLMGLWRIGAYSIVYLLAMLVVIGPSIVFPALWGVWISVRMWLIGNRNVIVLALFINALVIPFLPFSTFREPGGVLRFACGLVLAVLLFAGRYNMRRVLNYSLFWLVLNVFVFKA